MIFLYFIIGLLASTIGAIAGIGGGVFIKPMLDFLGHYPVATIGVLSSMTVLSMSIVSLWTRRREVKTMDRTQAILLASGAVLGGLIGKGIFTSLLAYSWVGAVQTSLLILIFSAVLFYVQFKENFPVFHVKDKRLILIVGLALGLLSAFLDIGGGPHNIALLSLFFAMHAKQAGLYSIFIICFSQLSSMLLTIISVDLLSYDLAMLPGMIIGGILGGAIGSHLSKWLSLSSVEVVFKVVISGLTILNIYNLYTYF
ncbi:TSUP family transporter [Amphibacillus sp. Q70]|uniref:TSUP family transporter n=1 Tax=Amphibacillus sp. Q70 TaxID=3453416 RepID=UPI003F832EC4